MTNTKIEHTNMLKLNHENVSVDSINTKYQGFFKLDEYQLSHQLFSGKQSPKITREIFERGDAVVVLAYDKALDMLVFVEQFRAGAIRSGEQPWLLEFIAGMFGENEQAIDVAIREAEEEAGLMIFPSDLTPIMKYLSSPGGMSECIHLYLATIDSTTINVNKTYGLAEEHEDILLHLISRAESLELLAQGKITNAATIIGLQWLELNYQKL
jgi:ADP-ribose pyrophosphatase